jgi:hypothetical protein
LRRGQTYTAEGVVKTIGHGKAAIELTGKYIQRAFTTPSAVYVTLQWKLVMNSEHLRNL